MEERPSGTAPLDAVLAALEPYFRNSKTLSNAAFAFNSLTYSATPQEKAILGQCEEQWAGAAGVGLTKE
jgi:hypothetical protein